MDFSSEQFCITFVSILAVGQFRTKKTGFEVTVSELIFLGQNMLVRPHEVHWGQFQLSPVILGAFLGPVGFLGPWEGQNAK